MAFKTGERGSPALVWAWWDTLGSGVPVARAPLLLTAAFGRVLWARLIYELWGEGLTLEGTLVLPERPLLQVPAGRLLQGEQGSEARRLNSGDPGASPGHRP